MAALVIAIVVIVPVVIVTVVLVTVVIVKLFSKNNFNILTTEENFEGQRFAILAMFFSEGSIRQQQDKTEQQVSDVSFHNIYF